MRVYLTAYTQINLNDLDQFFLNEKIENFDINADSPTVNCELGGRLCYMSFNNPRPGGTKAYFANILRQKHESVLEHAYYTFIITGVSRSLTHELVRHRIASYSQLSQRYVDQVSFIKPDQFAALPTHLQVQIEQFLNKAETLYYSIIEALPNFSRKQSREIARYILPNMTETKIQVTMNARALSHFFLLRGSLKADYEIRKLAVRMYKLVSKMSPNLFQHIKLVEDRYIEPVSD